MQVRDCLGVSDKGDAYIPIVRKNCKDGVEMTKNRRSAHGNRFTSHVDLLIWTRNAGVRERVS